MRLTVREGISMGIVLADVLALNICYEAFKPWSDVGFWSLMAAALAVGVFATLILPPGPYQSDR